MTSTPLAQNTSVVINRPSATSVGTIVWLASEVMFFAGLFAMYFSLRANAPEIWANDTQILDVGFALINTLILVASSFTAQFGVFAA
jgi:cytochrome c oxidase subunit 3